jgi:hypothetical protein
MEHFLSIWPCRSFVPHSGRASYGITAIWFEHGAYDLIENILRHLRNEVRYRSEGRTKTKMLLIQVRVDNVSIPEKKIGFLQKVWAELQITLDN